MIVASAGLGPALAPRTPNAFGFLKSKGAPGRVLGARVPVGARSLGRAAGPRAAGSSSSAAAPTRTRSSLSDDDVRAVVEKDLSTVLATTVEARVLSP